jgi:hypothetical protein
LVKSKFGGGAELDRTKLNYGLDIRSVLPSASCDASSSSPSNQISESLLAHSQPSSSEHLPLLISSPNDWRCLTPFAPTELDEAGSGKKLKRSQSTILKRLKSFIVGRNRAKSGESSPSNFCYGERGLELIG